MLVQRSLLVVPLLCAFVSAGAACGDDDTSVGLGGTSSGSAGASGGTSSGSSGHADSGASSDATLGDGPTFATTDADAAPAQCQTLNIGILGSPGPLPSANFQQWLISAGTSATRIQTGGADVLTSTDLAVFDVIVLDELQHDYSPTEVQVLSTWMNAGGGVVSLTGYTNDPSVDFRANALLAPIGMAYVGDILNGPVTEFVPHPITAGLTSVTFAGGYVVSDLGTAGATRTPIASLPAGNIAYAAQFGQGRALVWGDEWIEYDSEWTTIPEIKQLWVQAFEWLAPSNRCKLTPPS